MSKEKVKQYVFLTILMSVINFCVAGVLIGTTVINLKGAEAAEEKKAPAKKKAFSFKSFFDMFSSPQKILQGAEFYFCYSSIFIPLSLNRFLRRSTDDELSAVFVRINALSAAI